MLAIFPLVMTDTPSRPRDGLLGLSYRQIVAIVALINAFVATYLHLWKIGKAGTLACGDGHGCAIAQMIFQNWLKVLLKNFQFHTIKKFDLYLMSA